MGQSYNYTVETTKRNIGKYISYYDVIKSAQHNKAATIRVNI